ncbi:hypothetical protein V6N13_022982 [Hibiscus sabdariffa]
MITLPEDQLTHVQVSFTWNLSPLRPSKFSFEYLLLPLRSAPTAAPPGLTPRVLRRPPRPPTHRGLALAPTAGYRHSSPSFGSRQACSHSNPSQKIKIPWSVFQDGPDGEPAGRCPEHAGAEARRDGACWVPRSRRRRLHGRIEGPGLGRHHDPRRSTPRADRRTGSRCSTSDRGASPAPIRFPPDNFKHSLTLFSKSFSSFTRGTCSLSVSRPYLALDGFYRPIRVAFPNNPTRRQRLVVRQGPGTTGLSPSPAPLSRGLGPGLPLRTLLQTTIRTPRATDSQAGLFPVRSPLLRESFAHVSAAHAPRTGVQQQTTTFSFRILGIIHAGGCSFCHGDTGSHVTGTGRGRGAMKRPHPLPLMFDNTFTGRSARQVSTMILPQVHLRKPCYDFSFL